MSISLTIAGISDSGMSSVILAPPSPATRMAFCTLGKLAKNVIGSSIYHGLRIRNLGVGS